MVSTDVQPHISYYDASTLTIEDSADGATSHCLDHSSTPAEWQMSGYADLSMVCHHRQLVVLRVSPAKHITLVWKTSSWSSVISKHCCHHHHHNQSQLTVLTFGSKTHYPCIKKRSSVMSKHCHQKQHQSWGYISITSRLGSTAKHTVLLWKLSLFLSLITNTKHRHHHYHCP